MGLDLEAASSGVQSRKTKRDQHVLSGNLFAKRFKNIAKRFKNIAKT